jgi:hypothetical protein
MPKVLDATTPNLAAIANRYMVFVHPCSKPEENTNLILYFWILSIIIFNEVLHFRSQLCFHLQTSFQNAVSLKIQSQKSKRRLSLNHTPSQEPYKVEHIKVICVGAKCVINLPFFPACKHKAFFLNTEYLCTKPDENFKSKKFVPQLPHYTTATIPSSPN